MDRDIILKPSDFSGENAEFAFSLAEKFAAHAHLRILWEEGAEVTLVALYHGGVETVTHQDLHNRIHREYFNFRERLISKDVVIPSMAAAEQKYFERFNKNVTSQAQPEPA